ncbi:PIN domain-like protein [Mycena rosella]|uniref:PIN domain-like protein n=1 Tax=Mycena rosella TaxID=1033263 RepID=A0AAD7DKH2_MYCRO|nr:PIN domain-like protein [Mycena rosella]
MGTPKLWEIVAPAVASRSLLNLSTIKGFQTNHRGLRTLIIGVDIRQALIRIYAIVAALKSAGVFHPGVGGQTLVLEKLFYQLCNFSLAPVTLVFIFDGPGRPSVKRGTKVIYRPAWLIQHLKTMITSFGYYVYDAPGEAEAELGQLSEHGKIDGIITEDSDAFIFGAQCVIRTAGPYVENMSSIYTMESIETTNSVSLDKDGLFLCALLIGGDYHTGVPGFGPTIARALAAGGFGQDLVRVLRAFKDPERGQHLAIWRNSLRYELQTNLSGRLDKRQPMLANHILDTFPDLDVANLYLDPLTSRSPEFVGQIPNTTHWIPREPSIGEITDFCSVQFGWSGEELLKKLHNNLWPGVTFRLISSVKFTPPFD